MDRGLLKKVPYRVPFAKPYFTKEDVKAVSDVVKSGWLTQGLKVDEFERIFAKYLGVKHAVAVSSGTAALHVAASALGIGVGDEVIVPPLSFIATANVVLYQNAKPVFADIDAKTFNMDPERVKEAITGRTKAIIPIDYAGQPAEMDAIMEIAEDHSLWVIEDAAEAHGAVRKGRKAGTIGHVGCFSFYPNKNMTTGEGGMIVTDDDELAERMRMIRSHGQDYRYHHVILGYNYRITEMQAAMGMVQLKRLDWIVNKKARLARRYDKKLSRIETVKTPFVAPSTDTHAYMLYTIKAEKRDEVKAFLDQAGIETRVCFPAIHLQPLYRKLFGFKEGEYPISEEMANCVLSLPIFPQMSYRQQDYVIENVAKAYQR